MTNLPPEAVDLAIRQMREIRGYLVGALANVEEAAWTEIAPPFRNHVLWNAGHIITDQCNMIYLPCDLELPTPKHFNTLFDPGTSPDEWDTAVDPQEVVAWAEKVNSIIESDLTEGTLDNYAPATMDDGAEFRHVVDAIAHANNHEAYHLGIITSMLKLIAARDA